MSDSHKSRSRKRHESRSRSVSEPRQNRSKGNVDDAQEKLSTILQSVEEMQNKFTALSEHMTAMESRFCHQEKAVGEKSMETIACRLQQVHRQKNELSLLNYWGFSNQRVLQYGWHRFISDIFSLV